MRTLAGTVLFAPFTILGLIVVMLMHPAAVPWPQTMQTMFFVAFGVFQWLYVVPIAMWFGRRNETAIAFGLLAGATLVTLLSWIVLFAFVVTR